MKNRIFCVGILFVSSAFAGPFEKAVDFFNHASKPKLESLQKPGAWSGRSVTNTQAVLGGMMMFYPKQDPLLGVSVYAVQLAHQGEDHFANMTPVTTKRMYDDSFRYVKLAKATPFQETTDPLHKDLFFTYGGDSLVRITMREGKTEAGVFMYVVAEQCMAMSPNYCRNSITGDIYTFKQLMGVSYFWNQKLVSDPGSEIQEVIADPLE